MLNEVLEALNPEKGDFFLDCTLGGAGYTLALAGEVGSQGKVLSLDLDELALKNAREIIKKQKIDNVILDRENFKNLDKAAIDKLGDKIKFKGIVMDLGLSSAQLEDKNRGLSYQKQGGLDMSFESKGDKGENSAKYILNNYKQAELTGIFRKYGEEPWAGRISKAVVEGRTEKTIESNLDLSRLIEKAIPKKELPKAHKIKARIFQALRIIVNEELENLEAALGKSLNFLGKKGTLAIVSYHSLEDRVVKRFFQTESRDCLCPPEIPECRCGHKAEIKVKKFSTPKGTKKFLTPTEEEIQKNPRARSARLRVAIKI